VERIRNSCARFYRIWFSCVWFCRAFTLLLLAEGLAFAVLSNSAKELLNAGRADDAIRTLDQQIEQSPTDAVAHNLLCRAYYMIEEWDRAIAECERARNLDPNNSLYHLWLGRAYGEKADHAGFLSGAGLAKKVRSEFERAVELDPKSWAARSDLAEFYVEAPSVVGGGKEKAAREAEALMPLNPGLAHWIRARLAEKEKDSAGAEREYREEIAASHSGIRGWVDLAIFFRHANRLDEMEDALHKAESSPMERPESLMDGANLLYRTGRDQGLAIRLLRRYLEAPVEEGPAFRAHELLGQILEKQGNRQAAAEEYRAALALAHSYSRAQQDLRRVEH
jgi:tetratricopeptide (TPR) repeat protein